MKAFTSSGFANFDSPLDDIETNGPTDDQRAIEKEEIDLWKRCTNEQYVESLVFSLTLRNIDQIHFHLYRDLIS